MREIALLRAALPNDDSDDNAGDDQQPKDRCRPVAICQERDHIGDRVLGHRRSLCGATCRRYAGDPGGALIVDLLAKALLASTSACLGRGHLASFGSDLSAKFAPPSEWSPGGALAE